jgi:hypothetical protein
MRGQEGGAAAAAASTKEASSPALCTIAVSRQRLGYYFLFCFGLFSSKIIILGPFR